MCGSRWGTRGRSRNVPGKPADRDGMGIGPLGRVNNPDGGTKALWPIFGIANQLLAAIALCLGTTVLLKMGCAGHPAPRGIALVTLVPLVWLLTVTFAAGTQKMFHPSPRIGFLAALRAAEGKRPALETAVVEARTAGNSAAESKAIAALATNALQRGTTSSIFSSPECSLVLAAAIVAVSVREWWRLLRGTRSPDLSETEPVWLPAHAIRERGSGVALGAAALTVSLLREWSGESAVDRVRARTCECPRADAGPAVLVDVPAVRASVDADQRSRAYLTAASERFEGVTRCC